MAHRHTHKTLTSFPIEDGKGKPCVPIERAFEVEVEEMNVFLAELDRRYYEELHPQYSVDEAMRRLVVWADESLASSEQQQS